MEAGERLYRWFDWKHLPPDLQAVSHPFQVLAEIVITTIKPGAERTAALRKLLEAKDCAVRAKIEEG